MYIHCLQHVAFENPGTIAEWAKSNNHTISYTNFFQEHFTLPDVTNIDALLVMGGYMNVDEETKHPWLAAEKKFIKQAINANKKVLGICLGSQLIAAALGCKVYYAAEKEIGFFPISFTNEALQHSFFSHFTNPYHVFHWHGDTFDLPDNAQLIASTTACRHQAFLLGNNVLALQFHFEMNETVIEDMLLYDGHELAEEGNFIQTKETIRQHYHQLQQNKKDMFLLLDKFLGYNS